MNNDKSHADAIGNATSSLGGIPLLKKVVLLVDVNANTRQSRAKVMRTLGVTVHCAPDAHGARSRMESGSYNLILVDLGADTDGAESLVQEIRLKHPRQLVAFLVGSPLFVAKSLRNRGTAPSRVAQSTVSSPVSKVRTSAKPFDFGQKIKDAEAEELASTVAAADLPHGGIVGTTIAHDVCEASEGASSPGEATREIAT